MTWATGIIEELIFESKLKTVSETYYIISISYI